MHIKEIHSYQYTHQTCAFITPFFYLFNFMVYVTVVFEICQETSTMHEINSLFL